MQDIRDYIKTIDSFAPLETFVSRPPFVLRTKTNPDQTLLVLFPTSETPDYIAEECNGVVFAHAKEKIAELCTPSEYAFDISSDDFDALFSLSTNYHDETGQLEVGNNDPELTGRVRMSADDTVIVRESIDGTLINLFYNPFENKWRTSTSRMYDAKQSFWTSPKSFDTLFRECLRMPVTDTAYTIECLDLTKEFTHSFIMRHPESRQIVACTAPSLTYVSSQLTGHTGSIHDSDISYFSLNAFRDALRAKGVAFQTSPNIETILDHLTMNPASPEMFTSPLVSRGVLLDVLGKRKYKVDYPQFKLIEQARGEHRNIAVEYTDALLKQYSSDLDIQSTAIDKLALLRIHFTDNASFFSQIDYRFYETCKTIQNLYFQIHVKRYYNSLKYLPEKYEQTLRQLHALYKRTGNKTTVHTVASHLAEKINGYIMYTQLM